MNLSFSFIIPVLNEASLIHNMIQHLREISRQYDSEIIVVDGDAEATTLRCIQEKQIKKVVSPKGRGTQMNKGASVAGGDVFLFLHADTELPADALGLISAVLDGPVFGGGAFGLGIKSDRPVFRLIERMVSFRSKITNIPYGDQAIFMRREVFEKLGGYHEIPIMEDVDLMRRMKKTGYMVRIIPEKVRTSPRRWEREGVLYCTLRNWTLMTLYLLGFDPEKLVKYYYPEKNAE
ncbi:MAG: TIGR04283 family arsenosugar biosynthesis glycosyltransferase [Thermodesulfovibrionales bacterium]|nr:TIGR04283 family arsenosugar biosynthesis glycosyltransferase [Thermodesulfovibrionales bacterium]